MCAKKMRIQFFFKFFWLIFPVIFENLLATLGKTDLISEPTLIASAMMVRLFAHFTFNSAQPTRRQASDALI